MTEHLPDWTRVIRTCGPELPAWIRHEVKALGAPAREQLVTMLREHRASDDPDEPTDDAGVHAAALLAEFGGDEALVRLCLDRLHEHADLSFAFVLTDLLVRLGPSVAPSVLDAYGRLRDDDADEAGHFVDVLARCGAREPRILAALLDALKRFPAETVGLVGHYGDARLVEPLLAEIDARGQDCDDPDHDPFQHDIAVGAAESIAMLGGTLTDEQREMVERDEALDDDYEEPYEAPARPAPNSPCWCGSERKYKKCHMAADEAQDTG